MFILLPGVLNLSKLFPVPTEWKVGTVHVAVFYTCLFNSYFLYDMSLAFFLPHFPQQEK